jgi:hypothetical protein
MLTCNTCGYTRFGDDESCAHCGNVAAWYRPSPIELRVACLQIQSRWTATEEQQRRSGAYRRVEWLAAEVAGESGRVNRKGRSDD